MKINKPIKVLIGTEIAIGSAAAFLSPIFALFIIGSIKGGSLEIAGAAVAITLITKSVLRVPLARYLDKTKGELANYHSLLIGFLIFGLTQFLYLFATNIWNVYVIQIISGIAIALVYTPWYGLFSRKLDSHHEDYEWSIGNSFSGIAAAVASYLGGAIAKRYGFSPIFVISGVIAIVGAISLAILKNDLVRVNNNDDSIVR